MRTLTAALAVVTLTIGLAAPGPSTRSTRGVDLTHAASDNVGFVARFHEHFGAAGGIVTSNDWNEGQEFFVVTDPDLHLRPLESRGARAARHAADQPG